MIRPIDRYISKVFFLKFRETSRGGGTLPKFLELADDHTVTMKIPDFDEEAKHGHWSLADGEIRITPTDADPGSPGEGGYTARVLADGKLMLAALGL